MRTLVRTSGPYDGAPPQCGVWTDPITTQEVLRVEYGDMAFRVSVCFARHPSRYAEPLNKLLRDLFGSSVQPRPILRRRSIGGPILWFCARESYWTPALDPINEPYSNQWIPLRLFFTP